MRQDFVRPELLEHAVLLAEILHEFIDKIVVHHRQKEQGVMQQRVEIYYKMVGHVVTPNWSKSQSARMQVSFGRIRDVVAIAA